jgi:hypothetical protein
MHHIRGMAILAALFLGAVAGRASGGEHRDPTGFSLVYPTGWSAVPGGQSKGTHDSLSPDVKAWLDKNSVNLDKMALILIRDGDAESRDTLNVVVENQQLPLNDNTLNTLRSTLPKQYESMGAKVEDVEGRTARVGLNQAGILEYRITFPFADSALRQKQVFLPGGGKTYIVTCTSRADTFADRARSFEEILATIKVPPPIRWGFDWNRVLMASLAGAAIGLFAGLLMMLLKFIAPKKPAG